MARAKHAPVGTLTIRGVQYVILPKVEYLQVRDSASPKGAADAHAFVRESIAGDLRAARDQARLTQTDLARRLGKSQTLVSQAESGVARVSERYVRAVLKACGLPPGWTGPSAKTRRRAKKRS
jgi:ribosome-binding protein aMBF1 (putative translation factor)